MGDKFLGRDSKFKKNKIPLAQLFIYFFLLFIIILGSIILILLKEPIKSTPTCGDGTFYDTCSLYKPYFCDQGLLIENVDVCGCPFELEKDGNYCDSEYFSNSREVVLNYTFNGEEKNLVLTVYGGVIEYLDSLPRSIYYEEGVIPRRDDFKLMKIENEIQYDLLTPLVIAINNLAPDSKEDQAKIAISLVQNIPYLEPEYVSFFGGKFNLRVSRYPYEVIYDSAGSCEGKSELLAFLLKEIGYGVSLFYYQHENHEAIGIKCPVEYSFDNSGYCFVETTMPSPISYSEGRYLGLLGSNKLLSTPEIVLLSQGISLGKGLDDYEDSSDLTKIVNKIDQGYNINYFEKKKFDLLREKYNLLY